jgi:hypothetical protein
VLHSFLQSLATSVLISVSCVSLFGQSSGRLEGTVKTSSGSAAAGVAVIATDQVTGRSRRFRTSSDGRYSFKLPPGAYRLSIEKPNIAQFDKDKSYGDFAVVKGDTLENVIIESSKLVQIDIPLAATQQEGSPQTQKATPDRWRIEFPEYDRYGDRGARGRDIPFKKGRWWDPYNQSVLKGDYPIRGDKLFMILSAVNTTSIEQTSSSHTVRRK